MKQALLSMLFVTACSKPNAPEGSSGGVTAGNQSPSAAVRVSAKESAAAECEAATTFFGGLNGKEDASCEEGLHRLGEWKAYAEQGAAACSAVGQADRAEALTKVAAAVEKQVAAGQARCQGNPSGIDAVASAAAAGPAAPRPPAFGCRDLHMQLGRYPGLLPDGTPPEAAPSLVWRNRRPTPPVPVEHGDDVTFVDSGIKDDQLALFRFVDGRFEQVRSVPIPRHPKFGAISSYQIAAAMSPKTLGLAVVSGRELFFIAIDRTRWTASKVVALGVESTGRISGLHAPHIAWGEHSFGLTADDDTRFIWVEVTEDGKASVPSYFKGSHHVPPLVAWNGERFGVLTGRADDYNAYSLGIWEMPTKTREHAYHPIVDPAPGAQLMSRILFHVSGALRWNDGAYHFGMLRQSESHRNPDTKAQIVRFAVGSAARFDDCGQPPEQ